MVDFEWYRSFISIYKHNSVSEAARTRLMTQPAMSQHLAALEAYIGEPLFIRTSRKIFPTERGKELYTQVAPLVEALEETTRNFNASSSPKLPVVRIGASAELFKEKIAPYLGDFNLRVIAQYGVAAHILELLSEEKLDLIVTSQKLSAPGVEYIPYFQEEFVVVASSDFDDRGLEGHAHPEKWLCLQNWITYGQELPIIRRFWREHFHKRPQLQPVYVLPDLHAILTAIEHKAGISILPTYMLGSALEANKVKIVAGSYRVTNDLYIAYKLKNRNLPHVKALIEALKKTL
ncbi:LysR family transcriptional regulator [Paenibacillus sp. HWE-109]|uniref:LysR family transcriptional regulator n=1 Tax=Paenibacillus sp. HWE-109 TaxID=1306526 RepID=UPI001EDF4C57|nr:LysR family transcriptional regulator [Paenibacillus sp. HWE-109]UKS27104.1 LysR family transcriptional regulator [Paenibacillus sp. HWE-109]